MSLKSKLKLRKSIDLVTVMPFFLGMIFLVFYQISGATSCNDPVGLSFLVEASVLLF